jgi:hypothetical protein
VRALPSRKPAWSKQTRTWWADVWRSPSATQWGEADFHVVVRLARLHEAILEEPGEAALHAAASALEDRLAAASEARPPVPTRELVHVRERTSRTRNGRLRDRARAGRLRPAFGEAPLQEPRGRYPVRRSTCAIGSHSAGRRAEPAIDAGRAEDPAALLAATFERDRHDFQATRPPPFRKRSGYGCRRDRIRLRTATPDCDRARRERPICGAEEPRRHFIDARLEGDPSADAHRGQERGPGGYDDSANVVNAARRRLSRSLGNGRP